jgi:hypothetical protein
MTLEVSYAAPNTSTSTGRHNEAVDDRMQSLNTQAKRPGMSYSTSGSAPCRLAALPGKAPCGQAHELPSTR